MSDGWNTGELERMQAGMIRLGVVTELDDANARVKVACGGLSTDWLPWQTGRAGATRTWSPPQVGEQVTVFAPYGDPAQAFVGGSIYQDAHPAPASSKDQETMVFSDGTTVDYNSATNTLTVNIAGAGKANVICKEATVQAATKVTLDTPDTFCTGNLTVAKSLTMGQEGGSATMKGSVSIEGPSLTHNGKNVGSTHTHGGIQPGGGSTAVPN